MMMMMILLNYVLLLLLLLLIYWNQHVVRCISEALKPADATTDKVCGIWKPDKPDVLVATFSRDCWSCIVQIQLTRLFAKRWPIDFWLNCLALSTPTFHTLTPHVPHFPSFCPHLAQLSLSFIGVRQTVSTDRSNR